MDSQNSHGNSATKNTTYNKQQHGQRRNDRRSSSPRRDSNYVANQPLVKTPLIIQDFVSNHYPTPLISQSTHMLTYSAYGMYANLWHSDNCDIIDQRFTITRHFKNYKKFIMTHSIKYSAINESMNKAYNFLASMSKQQKNILIVGIRPYIRDYVRTEAMRAKVYYISYRWLGGTLTNLLTVRKQIKVLTQIEKDEVSGALQRLSKNEVVKIKKKQKKLQQIFIGILAMNSVPDCVVVLCPRENKNAIKEAKILKIPIVALINTGDSPRDIDYPIYCNNFYRRSLYLFTTLICDAIVEGRSLTSSLKFAFRTTIEKNEFLNDEEVLVAKKKRIEWVEKSRIQEEELQANQVQLPSDDYTMSTTLVDGAVEKDKTDS